MGAMVVLATPYLACASPKRIVRTPSVAYVYNGTEHAIQSVRYEPCEGPGSGHVAIAVDRPIKPGEMLSMPVLKGCIDLIAIDIEGEVAGHQRNLRMQPGMVWRIRK